MRDEEGQEELSVAAAESMPDTDVDEIEIQKKYNKDEHKYPLDYQKYMRFKKDQANRALTKKRNLLGNYNVSLFYEEKIMILIRTLQLFGLFYIAFYEQWP